MKPKHLLQKLDDARIISALAEAEKNTSARLRVFVSHRRLGGDDVMRRAATRFEKLGMVTSERHGVLVYLAPHDQKFAIVGDQGIHEKCGEETWSALAGHMQKRLQREEFTEAVIDTVREIGGLLGRHFPRKE